MLRYPPTRIAFDANELECILRALARKNDCQHDARSRLRFPRHPGDLRDPFSNPGGSPESITALSKPSDASGESLDSRARTGLILSSRPNHETETQSDVVRDLGQAFTTIMSLSPQASPIRGQENDESEAMRVFTEDPHTEATLSYIRDRRTPAVMDDTPPPQSRLLRYLTEDLDHADDRTWYTNPLSH